ncbi:MAG: hypothetical protein IJT27_02025 [Clostridia bacterium]|nr:hypothetical protein [Clostridia bacterium]
MRYTFIEGFEEILAGWSGKTRADETMEKIGTLDEMAAPLKEFFSVLKAIFDHLKTFFSGGEA